MKVNSQLEEASLQVVTTAQETGLNSTAGMIYYNVLTNEMLIGDGLAPTGSFVRRFVGESDALGEVRSAMADEASFQADLGPKWVLADGAACGGTDFGEEIYPSSGEVVLAGTAVTPLPKNAPASYWSFRLEQKGVGGDGLSIPPGLFDGIKDIQQGILDFEAANPGFTVAVLNGPTDFVPDVNETFSFDLTVPDLRGKFLRGKNNGRVDTISESALRGGNPDGELELGENQGWDTRAHRHGLNVWPNTGFTTNIGATPTPVAVGDFTPYSTNRTPGVVKYGDTGPVTNSAISNYSDEVEDKFDPNPEGGKSKFGSQLEVRPTNVTVNYFIKVNR